MDDSGDSSSITYAALLRGINVGKHKRIAMADLRSLLEALGYAGVHTHLQSGNAVFTTPGPVEPGDLERAITDRIAADLGFDVPVMVRTGDELATLAGSNPYTSQTSDPKQLHVAFLSAQPGDDTIAGLDADAYAPDELAVADRALYLYRPNGIMGSRLPDLEKLLGVRVTERNWNTVTRLHELTR
jgi:uncharacterized protein (DUF1697 family)